ncbi:Riboflavin synthase-like beta-barrel [Penicillium atrosanguineum]|uniref:Riboflavin synthase-like beta-barrel n=1 Tax=Penicillium atrosanguineum TaxID=1132637 RepID=UPI002391D6E9|nr:Riboflavin synthase-like beta-barrel [Penicillium atrosanguineum]KAJ5292938.1 Riboflavin synthase-like beta-barrel [Penicillium atrosanguineum]
MPITMNPTLPSSPKELALSNGPGSKLFIAFISSPDPTTKQAWCPDVRAALPHINEAFTGSDAPTLSLIEVGQKPEWNNLQNVYRTTWGTKNIPALVRYQQVNGEVAETGRLVEGEIMNKEGLRAFIA